MIIQIRIVLTFIRAVLYMSSIVIPSFQVIVDKNEIQKENRYFGVVQH